MLRNVEQPITILLFDKDGPRGDVPVNLIYVDMAKDNGAWSTPVASATTIPFITTATGHYRLMLTAEETDAYRLELTVTIGGAGFEDVSGIVLPDPVIYTETPATPAPVVTLPQNNEVAAGVTFGDPENLQIGTRIDAPVDRVEKDYAYGPDGLWVGELEVTGAKICPLSTNTDDRYLVRGDDRILTWENPGGWEDLNGATLKAGLVGTLGKIEYDSVIYDPATDSIQWVISNAESATLRGSYALDIQATNNGKVSTPVRCRLSVKSTTTDIPANDPIPTVWL